MSFPGICWEHPIYLHSVLHKCPSSPASPAKWTTQSTQALCCSLICFYFLYITYCYLKLYYAFQVFHFLPYLKAKHIILFMTVLPQPWKSPKCLLTEWINDIVSHWCSNSHRPRLEILGLCVLISISKFVVEVCFLSPPAHFGESPS